MQHRQPFDSSYSGPAALFFLAAHAAAAQELAVDAHLAELVDDHRELAALRVGEQVAQQRGLATAEEAGDDGGGKLLPWKVVLLRSAVDAGKAGNAADEVALHGGGPEPEGYCAVGALAVGARVFDEALRRRVARLEVAEHVAGLVGSAQVHRAARLARPQAAHARHLHAGVGGGGLELGEQLRAE